MALKTNKGRYAIKNNQPSISVIVRYYDQNILLLSCNNYEQSDPLESLWSKEHLYVKYPPLAAKFRFNLSAY